MFAYQELDRKKARRAICPVSGNSVGCTVCQDPDRETLSLHEIPSEAARHTHAVFWRAHARRHVLANEPEWTKWQQINGENLWKKKHQLTSEWELPTPPCLSEDIPVATWVRADEARISSACQWDTALLMGPESMCVDLPQAHTPSSSDSHCPMSEYCMTPGNSKDMTACFGAWNVKTAPKRAFSSCPNRPHRVASVYCQHGVERRGGGYSRWILFSYQDGKNIKVWGRKWSQRTWTTVCM